MQRLKRRMCLWWGCWGTDDFGCCPRCDAHIYYPDYVETGSLNWILVAIGNIRYYFSRTVERVVGRRCDVCKNRFHPIEWEGDFCCSDQCYKNWIPF